jgi:hypothetical protein
MPPVDDSRKGAAAPILDHKSPAATSVFSPDALLREARRQKGLAPADVPAVCILDPDGDILRSLRKSGRAACFDAWPCYHTELFTFPLAGQTVGIIGCVVGAPFAVLVAEELFACGCRFLLNLTSAGQINAAGPTPYFVVIDRALRDEGTSYHYAAPAEFAEADPQLVAKAADALKQACSGRRQLDHRRAIPRNRRGDRGGARERRFGGGNGGGGALHLRAGPRQVGAVSRACHQHDGAGRAGF